MLNITQLPDIELEYILSYLDSSSLYHLTLLSERFDDIITHSKRLWKKIDARAWPNTVNKIKYCTDRIHQQTTEVKLRGDLKAESPVCQVLNEDFYLRIHGFRNLKILALENLEICPRVATIRDFPSSLEELSLRRSSISSPEQFFRLSSISMGNLRVLILDECCWVVSSLFMSISKYPKLEILSLYRCMNLENSVPYMSISGQYGFKNLKILDARITMLGNTLLRSLRRNKSVIGLYIQNKGLSFKLDSLQNQYDFWKGGWAHDYPLDEVTSNVVSVLNVDDYGKMRDATRDEDDSPVDDSGLFDYQSRNSTGPLMHYPESTLYADPYHTTGCNCRRNGTPEVKHYYKNGIVPLSDESDSDSDDDNRRGRRNLFRTIRGLRRIVAYQSGSPYQGRFIQGEVVPRRRRRRLEPSERHRLRHYSPDADAAQDDEEPVDYNHPASSSMEAAAAAAPTEQRRASSSSSGSEQNSNHNNESGFAPAATRGVDDRLKSSDDAEAGPSTSSYSGPSTSTARATSTSNSRHHFFARRNQLDAARSAGCGGETESKRQRNEDDDDHDSPGPSKRRHSDPSVGEQRPSTSRDNGHNGQDNGRDRPAAEEPAVVNIIAPVPYVGADNYAIQANLLHPAPDMRVGVIHLGNLAALQNLGRELPNDFVFRVVNAAHEVEDEDKGIGLKFLSLRGYKKITDKTLTYLRSLQLEVLDLTYTSVTQAGILHYLAEHPYCRVIHQSFCTCAPTMNL